MLTTGRDITPATQAENQRQNAAEDADTIRKVLSKTETQTNLFDEEVDDPAAVLAEVIKMRSNLNVNVEEFDMNEVEKDRQRAIDGTVIENENLRKNENICSKCKIESEDIIKNSDYVPVTVSFDASTSQVKDENIESKCGWSPFNGFEFKGTPISTIIAGQIKMRDGKILGDPDGTPLKFS